MYFPSGTTTIHDELENAVITFDVDEYIKRNYFENLFQATTDN